MIWRRLAAVFFVGGSFLLPALLFVLTLFNFGSKDFRSPECWIGDSGTWLTAHEVLMFLVMFVAAPVLLISSIAGLGLWRADILSSRSFLIIFLGGVTLGVLTYFTNAATNDAYIDRLYAACGRT